MSDEDDDDVTASRSIDSKKTVFVTFRSKTKKNLKPAKLFFDQFVRKKSKV